MFLNQNGLIVKRVETKLSLKFQTVPKIGNSKGNTYSKEALNRSASKYRIVTTSQLLRRTITENSWYTNFK